MTTFTADTVRYVMSELRKEIEKLCGNCDRPDKEELGKIILSSMTLGFNEGLKAPSADRPQGKWIDNRGVSGKSQHFPFECSECHDDNERTTNFCPNCGASMRERESE